MRDPRKFQLTSGPRGKYVYHRSPSGRKVTRNVPNSVVTKNDAVRFLRESGGRGATLPTPSVGGPKYIVIGGVRQPLKPKLPNQPLGCMALRHLSGMRKIGSGRQGVIYAANRRPNYMIREIAVKVTPYDKEAEKRGEKQPSEVEWDIQKVVQRVAWGGVVSGLSLHQCRDFVPIRNMNNINKIGKNIDPHRQAVLFMERADGGTFSKWVQSNPRLKDDDLLKAINKVLFTLHRILKTYPEFRHNDLHLDNILMFKGVPKIADLGWSRLKKMGTNPAVNTALANGIAVRYGIGPNTSSRYDMHLFLNELRRLITRMGKFPRTRAFLEKYIPVGYREFSDTYTTDGRLKYGMALPALPNIRTILKDSEMKWNRGSPSPARSANNGPGPKVNNGPKRRTPSPRKNFENKNFLAMTPRTFMKLSPTTRARAAAIRKAAKNKGGVVAKPQPKLKNNATAKRAPSPRRLTGPRVRISPRVLRSNKFNRLVTSFLNISGSATYQNRWNAARAKALNAVTKRLQSGKPAFSPSPVRPTPAPVPSAPRPRLPSPLSPLGPPPARRSPPGVVKSAGSGRFKVAGPSGRLVYADGSTVTMNYLRGLASRKGVNTTGLRTKESIARAIFNRT